MRIAILPIITFTNTEGESEFVMFRQMARDWVKHRGAHVYIVVPKHARRQIKHEPGITYLFEDQVGVFYEVHAETPVTFNQIFSPRRGSLQIDALMTSRTAHAADIARNLWDFRGPQIPVFIDESMAADFTSKVSPNTTDLDLFVRSAGYVSSAISFFDTPMELEMALRAGRRYLSGWALDQLYEKCQLFPCGMSTEKADRARADVPERNEKFTVFFGGRMNQMKRIHMTLELFDMFWKSGREQRQVICTPKGTGPEDLGWNDMPQVEMHKECSSQRFIREACRAHVMINTSQVEGFSIGLMEQIYLINVVLLPRLDWVKALLRDKYEEWPFLYSTVEEAYTTLCWIYDNYDEALEMVSWVPGWIKEMFDTQKTSLDMYDAMAKYLEENPPRKLSERAGELILRTAYRLEGKKFTLDEFEDMLVEEAEAYRKGMFDDPRRGKFGRWQVWRWLLENGFEDDRSCQIPVFKWTDKVPPFSGKFKAEMDAEQRAVEDSIVAALRAPVDGEEE